MQCKLVKGSLSIRINCCLLIVRENDLCVTVILIKKLMFYE